MAQLNEGTPEERGQTAEKLFNKAADDEEARQNAAAVGVIQPLVYVYIHPSCIIMTRMIVHGCSRIFRP